MLLRYLINKYYLMKLTIYLLKKFARKVYKKSFYLFYIINTFKLFVLKFLFGKKKIKRIESLIAYGLSMKGTGGAIGWLKFLIPKLKKNSSYNFRTLDEINYKIYDNYNINNLILFHPQSIGFAFSAKLINESKKIIFFINDNIIFCKKSYNVHNNKECFNCLYNYKPYKDCEHAPQPSPDNDYINFLSLLKKRSNDILFVCHSTSNLNITKKIYPNSKIFKTKHVSLDFEKIVPQKKNNYIYDFLFHGDPIEAKGYFYFLKLAKMNLKNNFFMPDFDLTENILNKNIHFDKMNWNNGLQEKINETKIILCPSLWSANFEGSVLKSMLMGKCCAIIKNANSFSNDIPNNSIIKLSGNIILDSKILRKELNNTKKIKKIGQNARIWALKYIKNNWKKDIKFLDTFLKD